ncbi:MAG: HipA domain-containing protein, partial [Comamonadaceae bacterium]|nr:HipA domain-containing protein [Comamonadaceae bacterium]
LFPGDSNFGVFLDSCPDRWGQVLMKRRELVEAKMQCRTRRELRAWDFLIGVQDITRMGALRFSAADDIEPPVFLANEALAAPPVSQLGALQQVALALSRKRQDDLSLLSHWLKVLVAPGASLGGARPKANLLGEGESLWIAKFPAADDESDVALGEKLVHDLAKQCGIDVPPSRLELIGHGYHTFLVQRFDRLGSRRRFFTSAMSLLNKTDKEEASYLDLAEFIATKGSPAHIADDLRELFRRVAFNVIVANRDDHLRNHGFVRLPGGWRLSPAFDMNSSGKRDSHVLALADHDVTPDLETVLQTAEFYRLSAKEAQTIVDKIIDVVRHWDVQARLLGLSAEDRGELDAIFLLTKLS